MERRIKNSSGEEVILKWHDGFKTYSTGTAYEGRMYRDMGDGRLYEYSENGGLGDTTWADAALLGDNR